MIINKSQNNIKITMNKKIKEVSTNPKEETMTNVGIIKNWENESAIITENKE